MNTSILSVSQITRLIKEELELTFSDLKIEGEISNFKMHVSGHWYFNLKDSGAVICCNMWKGINNYVFFTPEDGMKVVVTGRITVYPPRGTYQLEVRSMKPAGTGELQAAFERLKSRLAAEGLFAEENKKPIPHFPKKIGIITALDGAAFRDMISVAKRRFPMVELVIAPSKVQGEGAADSIVENLILLNERDDIDVIVAGRGGGSLEDLWAFNEEIVARAIFASRIPVVSAVGHEVDFTIADFVADLRAPTPSAAMELITPLKSDFISYIENFLVNSTENISFVLNGKRQQVLNCINTYGFRVPPDKIKQYAQNLDNLLYRIDNKLSRIIENNRNKLSVLRESLETGNVERILKKGFVIVQQDSKFVKRSVNLDKEQPVLLKFYDNEILINKHEQK